MSAAEKNRPKRVVLRIEKQGSLVNLL